MSKIPWGIGVGLAGVLGSLAAYAARLLAYLVPGALLGEEMLKWGAIWLLFRMTGERGWGRGMVVGSFFGLTEAVLYGITVAMGGDTASVVARILLTVPMHAVTGGISGRYKWGIVVAVVIHAVFNYMVR